MNTKLGKAMNIRISSKGKIILLLMLVSALACCKQSPSSFTVIDVTKDLIDLGYSSNAEQDVAGGGDAIQYAIDEFQSHLKDYYAIWVPPGSYKLTKPLIMGEGSGFTRVVMIGAPRAFSTEHSGIGGTILFYEGDGTGNEKETPMLIMQGMRSTHIQGIYFISRGNQTPRTIFSEGGGSAALYFNRSRSDWVDTSSVRTNPRSPQCVIAIDPFVPGNPGNDPANRYPGFEEYYGGAVWSNPRGSSDIHFEGCGAEGGYIGVAVSPPGDVGGVDLVQNAESFEFRDFYWAYNTIHFSQGQSQSRANNLHNPRMVYAWLCIDDGTIGPGGNAGINPTITGAANIGICIYVFNINLTTGNQLHLTQAHFENTISLGKLGTGKSSGNLGATFTNCLFNFLAPDIAKPASPTAPISDNKPEIPFHMMTWGINIFDNCTFAVSGSNSFIWRIWNASEKAGRTIFRGCHILNADRNGRVQFGFNTKDDGWVIDQVHSYNVDSGAVYQNDPKSLISWQDIDNGGNVQVIQALPVESRGTVSVSNTAGLAVGDLVHIKNTSPTAYIPAKLDSTQSAYVMYGPLGYISSIIADTSITIDGLPTGFPFDQNVRLEASTWRNDL